MAIADPQTMFRVVNPSPLSPKMPKRTSKLAREVRIFQVSGFPMGIGGEEVKLDNGYLEETCNW
jgi:hypothetical protein